MKKHLLFVLAAIHFFGYMSCEKEKVIPTLPAPVEVAPPSIPEKINTAPKVFVGSDLFVFTPSNDTRLNGSYSDAENNLEVLKWTKIAGPASFSLENEYSLGTKVSQLEKGLYQFELAVTDSLGLSARDTIKVIVGETPTSGNEKVVVHGDPEREMETERMENGIPVSEQVVNDLKDLGSKFGVGF